MARHWASRRTPVALHLFYVVKILAYIGVAAWINRGHSWTEPIVFQKVVLYTMLFEVVGFGCGFGPLNNRFFPPMGSALYWLRPNTIRLPPWPGRVPLTKGDNREPIDILLYAVLLVVLVIALFSSGTATGLLPVWQPVAVLILLALIGLRIKVIFPGRPRRSVRAPFVAAFLFGGINVIIAAKLVCMAIWLGFSRRLEAHPALPVRGVDDDVQQSRVAGPCAQAQVLPRLPRGSAPRLAGEVGRTS